MSKFVLSFFRAIRFSLEMLNFGGLAKISILTVLNQILSVITFYKSFNYDSTVLMISSEESWLRASVKFNSLTNAFVSDSKICNNNKLTTV